MGDGEDAGAATSSATADARPAVDPGEPATALRALAGRAGILDGYHDMDGTWRPASDAARERLLTALGFDVADDAAAARALVADEAAERQRPVAVARVAVTGAAARRVPLLVADAAGRRAEWQAELLREDGQRVGASGHALLDRDGRVEVDLGFDPPLGYHRMHVTVRGGSGEWAAEQALVVVPPRCPEPAAVLGRDRAMGITVSLYAVRSARNWGAGDLTDLHALSGLAAKHGAAFVGVNPLHALRTEGAEPSPYSPISRRYRHLLYLDVEAVAEYADDPAVRALAADPALRATVDALRARDQVDHVGVLAAKRPVLEALHRAFRTRPSGHPRRRAYDAYVARQGPALDRFAVFAALDEHFRAAAVWWWRDWPAPFRDPDGAAVADFARAHPEAVDFHRWCQFELDTQLAGAAAAARAHGLAVGLYQDLAVGASPAGADVWGDAALYASGCAIGAPPDPLGPEGQNWGLPPWNPRVLAERGYRDWGALVRAAIAHAGALRIDHALGIFRQFWIPDGASGRDGAYVRFPAEALLGVLALESVRANGGAGALVVGEDLGTVPPEVGPALTRWGVLSSKVLYFERGAGGTFRPPREYPAAALATVNTHDLAPLAGWWLGRDVELRHAVGQLADDEVDAARAERARDRAALVRMLIAEGALDAGALDAGALEAEALDTAALDTAALDTAARDPAGRDGSAFASGPGASEHGASGDGASGDGVSGRGEARDGAPDVEPSDVGALAADALDEATVRAAVHRALRGAPSCLVGIALEDVTGEIEPVNMPGVGGDKFASWTRRLSVGLEALAADPTVGRLFGEGGAA